MAQRSIEPGKAPCGAIAAKLSKVDEDICYPEQAGGCFIKGTRVYTREGKKPIEEIQVGDWVLSCPEDSPGQPEYKRVVRTFAHDPQPVFRIIIHPEGWVFPDPSYFVVATGNHPFWVEGVGWTCADALNPQQWLRQGDGGRAFVGGVSRVYRTGQEGIGWVSSTLEPDGHGSVFDYANYAAVDDSVEEKFLYLPDEVLASDDPYLRVPVFNLEVEDFHTYYVGGKHGFWVHNANCEGVRLANGDGVVPPFCSEHLWTRLSGASGDSTAPEVARVGFTAADTHGNPGRVGKLGRLHSWCGNARWLWLVMLLGTMSAQAQPLSLADLLQRAHASEPTFLGAKAAVSTAQAREDQAFGALLPQLSASAGTHANSRNYATRNDITPRASDEYNNHSAQISLTQPLWRPAELVGLKQARIMVAQAEYQLTAAEQELAARLVEAWFDLLAARDAKAFAEQQVAALEQQWRVSIRAEELGGGSQPQTEDALAKLEQARADAAVAETDIELKRAAMEQWVGPLPEFTLPHLNGAVVLIDPAAQALDVWLQEVEAGNPSVLAARRAYEAAEAEVSKQRAGHSPTLDLVASYGQNSQAVGGFPGQAGYDIKQGSIGVQLNVPLYSGGTQSAKVAEALAQEERASQEIEAARRSAVLAAKRAWFTWRGAVARAAAGAQSIRAARAELARTGRGSERGLQTRLEILQAEQQLRAGQRDFCKGRYDQIVSLIRLKAAAGTLLLSDVTRIDGLLVPLREAADPEPWVHVAEAGNR
ncbi:TolC family outer membrane protein [Pseudomonas sp. NCHU5208]|uniref:TolC family outer membrane protein n=1 Tax=unclassified Pseudomonas TaxID=196821 RepID=UPI003F9CE3A6